MKTNLFIAVILVILGTGNVFAQSQGHTMKGFMGQAQINQATFDGNNYTGVGIIITPLATKLKELQKPLPFLSMNYASKTTDNYYLQADMGIIFKIKNFDVKTSYFVNSNFHGSESIDTDGFSIDGDGDLIFDRYHFETQTKLRVDDTDFIEQRKRNYSASININSFIDVDNMQFGVGILALNGLSSYDMGGLLPYQEVQNQFGFGPAVKWAPKEYQNISFGALIAPNGELMEVKAKWHWGAQVSSSYLLSWGIDIKYQANILNLPDISQIGFFINL